MHHAKQETLWVCAMKDGILDVLQRSSKLYIEKDPHVTMHLRTP